MKGLEQIMFIIVSAVILLIVAIVLLTIFGRGVELPAELLQFKNVCLQQAAISCSVTKTPDNTDGSLPPNWAIQTNVIVNGKPNPTSCQKETGCNDCGSCASLNVR